MDIKSFESLIRSERTAYRYLARGCWKNKHKFCPRCKVKNPHILGDGRYRCRACGYTFNDFTGRYLSRARIGAKGWLWVIKLFELELSTRKIQGQLGISYPTALKAVDAIRMYILARESPEILSGEVEVDEVYFGGRRKGKRGRGAAGKVPVFGILEQKGKVSVEVVQNVSARTLMTSTVKKVKRGSVVYTDKFRGYDSLMFCGYRHLKVDHGIGFTTGKVYINGLEGFWSFAKERMAKFHGVSKEKFPLYLKEMEFRYNNRDRDIFEEAVDCVCSLVPELL